MTPRKDRPICIIPTTVGIDITQGARSAIQASNLVDGHLNPELSKCGSLPECRGCSTFHREVVIGQAARIRSSRTQVGDLI